MAPSHYPITPSTHQPNISPFFQKENCRITYKVLAEIPEIRVKLGMKILPVKQNVGQGWFLVLGIKAFLEARGVDRGCIITNFESELVV